MKLENVIVSVDTLVFLPFEPGTFFVRFDYNFYKENAEDKYFVYIPGFENAKTAYDFVTSSLSEIDFGGSTHYEIRGSDSFIRGWNDIHHFEISEVNSNTY